MLHARNVLRSLSYLFSALLLCIFLSSSLSANPLIPLGGGATTINAEKRVSTGMGSEQEGTETEFSLQHGMTNSITFGLGRRTIEFTEGDYEATSFSLILDIGKKRFHSGKSSFYGKKFHGKKTANGETYNMYGISAAHKELPLGSEVLVTNKENGKSVVVKINDRGPYVKGRVLDLSYGAAKKIGLDKKGTGDVEIESLSFSNFSLIGGVRQVNSKEKDVKEDYNSIYYGIGADFRLERFIKAYVYSARDSHTSFIEYEGGLMLDMPGHIKAGVNYGRHIEQFEGPGVFLQCKF